MKLANFDFRVWVGGFAIANGEVWNGGYIDDSYMKENQFNKVIAMGLVKFYDKNKEKLDDVEFFTFYKNVGFNHGVSDDIEIELWSGFYDSKGTKIYEGDIVKLKDGIYRVWLKNGFFLEDNANNVYTMWFASKYGEVIGNIHENLALLQTSQNE